jgi:hypothetical protein
MRITYAHSRHRKTALLLLAGLVLEFLLKEAALRD